MYEPTTALRKILQLKKRIRAVSGGARASKTVSILQWHIDYAQCHTDEVLDIVAESYPHLDVGCIAEFKRIMTSHGYWRDESWNGGAPRRYTFQTGSAIQFSSFDSVGKAHGPTRDVLYLNEAPNIPWLIVDQLITRTKKIIWMDWNPYVEFWFDTEDRFKQDDVDYMGDGGNYPPLTYLDNEMLDEGQKSELLAHRNNINYWRVYGEGLRGQLQGRIFTNWKTDLEQVPHEARLERYGLDFGYTNDPTAIVAIYYYNGGYILDEIAYTKGLSNKQIADILLNQKQCLVVADSAEPKSIDEIRAHGVTIIPTTKGPGSVLQRIQMAQDQQISVTKRSVNVIKEYRNYLWETDREGRILNEPEHTWSHSMDAATYALASLVPMIQRADMINNMPVYATKERKNPVR